MQTVQKVKQFPNTSRLGLFGVISKKNPYIYARYVVVQIVAKTAFLPENTIATCLGTALVLELISCQ